MASRTTRPKAGGTGEPDGRTRLPAAAPPARTRFDGFSSGLLDFLRGLEARNDKTWFEAHRAQYDAHYVDAACRFVEAIGPGLRKLSKGLRAEARVNGSIMRIHRDTRFSKDKTPYKTGLFLLFTEGGAPMKAAPGFGLHIGPRSAGTMGGLFGFDDAQLARFRQAVIDPKRGAALERAIAEVTDAGGCALNEPHYKRVPKGLDSEHPRAELLRYRALFASREEAKPPKALFSSDAVDFCLERFRAMRPVQKWLVDALGAG